MNKQKPVGNHHFPLLTIAVLAAVLVAGCTSTRPSGSARTQNVLSGGAVASFEPVSRR